MAITCFLCKWRSDKHPRRSFHKFPSDQELKKKWLQILGKSNLSIGTRTSLCCLHFEENCFRYGLVNGRRILKDGSLPTFHPDIDNKNIHLIEFEIPLFASENILAKPYPPTDDVQMEETIYKLEIEDNPVQAPLENYSPKELPMKSNSLDVSSKEDEIRRLKRKVTTLQRLVKRLRHSKHKMKSQLTDLKEKTRHYEAEKKLMHESMIIGI